MVTAASSAPARISAGFAPPRGPNGTRIPPLAMARIHGGLNLVGGLWPLLHMRSFEAVLGPKTDRWLVNTVAGLMIAAGATQAMSPPDEPSLRQARRIGVGVAATLGIVDLVYAPTGRISRRYLVDAAGEIALLIGWARTDFTATARTGPTQRQARTLPGRRRRPGRAGFAGTSAGYEAD
jgi:hypothetical protein